MRAIFVGIEYAGKSTLIELLDAYYQRLKLHPHIDDHFTIPDSELSPESRELALKFPDDVKERTQRMQIHYHIDIVKFYEHVLLAGWHIEESIYTSLYGPDPSSHYYPGYWYQFQRQYEAQLLKEDLPGLVLIHVTAEDDTIQQRMRDHPHKHQVIREEHIAELKRRFSGEVEKSLLTQGREFIDLDTTAKTPQQSLDELLTLSEPLVSTAELAMRSVPVPATEYDVRYENGVRKLIPKSTKEAREGIT